MKVIVTISGGKDSTAALLYTIHNFCNGNTKNILAVFCDTGFENEITYQYLNYLEDKLNIKIIRLRNPKFDGFIDMVKQKRRFPSTKARFCTEELKVKPMIDFILDNVQENILVVQGIRSDESKARAKMNEYCTYFKGYFHASEGKRKYSYRRKEVLTFCEKYAHEVWRPIIEWNTQQVFDYIKDCGFEWNPLYDKGFKRVGCFPCIMATKNEVELIAENFELELKELELKELELKTSFFPPNYIPKRYCSKVVTNAKGKIVGIPSINDVREYLKTNAYKRNKRTTNKTEQLFCKNEIVSCHY